MRGFDFTPLFRSSVGFDRLAHMLDVASHADEAGSGYPPYNIEKLGQDAYRVTMAVAGFAEKDIDITVQDTVLLVRGKVAEQNDGSTFLHRGIAGRAFERRFQLADHIEVRGARLENGLLHIDLVREVPEAMKPRRIEVRGGADSGAAQIESGTARAA